MSSVLTMTPSFSPSASTLLPSLPPPSSPPTTSRNLLSRSRKYMQSLSPETLVLLPLRASSSSWSACWSCCAISCWRWRGIRIHRLGSGGHGGIGPDRFLRPGLQYRGYPWSQRWLPTPDGLYVRPTGWVPLRQTPLRGDPRTERQTSRVCLIKCETSAGHSCWRSVSPPPGPGLHRWPHHGSTGTSLKRSDTFSFVDTTCNMNVIINAVNYVFINNKGIISTCSLLNL